MATTTAPTTTAAAAPVGAGDRPPYLAAVGVFAVVLAGYVATLAPTVTFWDAGEFIATAKILGIPHPPGTPLFVLLGNVFGTLVPLGEFAYRTNLMTAIFSAAAAACLFLVVVQALRGWRGREAGGDATPADRLYVFGGGVAAALVSAFVFTVWQNSNETEVYMVATFSIAAICWLAWLWRRHRGTMRASHLLLLIVYIGAVSIGNHLLTLLVGPAIVGYVWHVLRSEPLPDERDRHAEWAQWAVLTGVWALLIGAGLGSTALLVLGGVAFVAAAVFAASVGSLGFALTVLGIGAVGVSTYLFLYVRAGLAPFINEADPSTWESLLSVIRREQYPPRLPTDNPIFPSGPDNPGRSLTIIWLQMQNYLQYFDWQWANGLAATTPVFAPARLPFTALFTTLGFIGLAELRQRDRSVFWLLLLLFLATGPGLMGYMNFKPGYSLGWDLFPQQDQHEVRERDYFFTVSFQTWGLFVGMGLAALGRVLRERLGAAALTGRAAALGAFAVALVPLAFNFTAASRKHTPTATLARDFAYNLLQSVEPYGIVFTNGDNDTFPLWYLQEVEGVRRDVAVVNLSLGNTDWYLRQLRDNPVRHFRPEQAPWFAPLAPAEPPPALHRLTDAQIAAIYPQLLSQPFAFRVGEVNRTFERGTPLYVKDVLMMRLMQENAGRRPIYYSVTAGSSNWLGLHRHMANEGLVVRVHFTPLPDESRLVAGSVLGIPVDLSRTDSLVNHVYRYAGLFEADTLALDPTNRNIALNLSLPFLALGQAFEIRGRRDKALEALRRGYHLSPSADLGAVIEALSVSPDQIPFGDTAISDSGR